MKYHNDFVKKIFFIILHLEAPDVFYPIYLVSRLKRGRKKIQKNLIYDVLWKQFRDGWTMDEDDNQIIIKQRFISARRRRFSCSVLLLAGGGFEAA